MKVEVVTRRNRSAGFSGPAGECTGLTVCGEMEPHIILNILPYFISVFIFL